jgi:hypothetical protein
MVHLRILGYFLGFGFVLGFRGLTMAALLTISGCDKKLKFECNTDPVTKYANWYISRANAIEVELSGAELKHAVDNLGAARVIRSGAVRYFGDEAKRIVFN